MKESMNLKDLKNSNTLVCVYIDKSDVDMVATLEETIYSISKQTAPVDLLVLCPSTICDKTSTESHTLEQALNNPKITFKKKNPKGEIEDEVIVSENKINYFLKASECDTFSKIFNEAFNVALENEYEFFSVIESYDVVGLNWYNQANIYSQENKNVSAFLPIVRNTVNGVFSGLLNEAPWAEGMAEEAGIVDLNMLSRFNCIIPIGGLFKINAIKEYSEKKEDKFYPFKESIKISHYYEFLMRMVYNDVKFMTIPRIGYEFKVKSSNEFKHTSCKIPLNIVQIPLDKGGITQDEGKFWIDCAKKEYFFDEDRMKTYDRPKE